MTNLWRIEESPPGTHAGDALTQKGKRQILPLNSAIHSACPLLLPGLEYATQKWGEYAYQKL